MNSKTLIEAKEVSKKYVDGRVTAVDSVSISVNEGEFLVIMGPSGSGKSTLLHLVAGLDSPTGGEVLFEEQPLKDALKQSRFRIRNIGFVFQSFYLWPTLN